MQALPAVTVVMQIHPDDLDWLTGPRAAAALERLVDRDTRSVEVAASLRKEFSAERARLLLQQAELRRRGVKKFAQAARMLFTPRGLEQATDEVVAAYKAERFPTDGPLADLCCGIGGDLTALAGRAEVFAADLDPVCARCAAWNCRAVGRTATVSCRDVTESSLTGFAAWHIDPDRRPAGSRTSQVLHSSPGIDVIEALQRQCPHAAIKLAPAACAPEHWGAAAEREWISRDGECKQQVAWFGQLARRAGDRSATVLRSGQRRTVFGSSASILEPASAIGRYLYDPDAAILAARLVPALAAECGLCAIDLASAYVTGDDPVHDLALSAFEVLDVLPLDVKQLRAWLRRRGIGKLEIKKRGINLDPPRLLRKLAPSGEEQATLIGTRFQRRIVAVLCRRPATPRPTG